MNNDPHELLIERITNRNRAITLIIIADCNNCNQRRAGAYRILRDTTTHCASYDS